MIQTQVEFFLSLSMAHLFLKVPKPWFSSARKKKEISGFSCLLSISKSLNMPRQGRPRLGQATTLSDLREAQIPPASVRAK